MDDTQGWIARSFTRARVLSTKLARIPFGDKSLELPIVLGRTQLSAIAVGAVASVLAYGLGSALGIAKYTTGATVVLTVVVVVVLALAPVPDRGSGIYVEGATRVLARTVIPGVALATSSRPREVRRPRRRASATRMRIHPAPSDSTGRR